MRRHVLLLCAASGLFGACIEFSAKEALYCEHNPGVCDGGASPGEDGGVTSDGGGLGRDAGADAGPGVSDAGPGSDAGSATDAGPGNDAGAGSDAGSGTDAGFLTDAGFGTSDAGSGTDDAGSAVDAGFCRAATGGFDAGATGGTGTTGTVFYVNAATGLDTNGGGVNAPFKTISYAIALASAGSEIHVCAGGYTGPITLSKAVSLKGGYSCDGGWNRTATYGFGGLDGGFDGVNETVLTSRTTGSTTCAATLTVSAVTGSTIGRTTVIDGFTINGNVCDPGYSATPAAVQVGGSGASPPSPTITNNKILGGGGSGGAGAIGSFGIIITNGAAPDVGFNRITGGSGVSITREGSVGVFLDGNPGSAHLHDNVIQGGNGSGSATGTPSLGSIGIGNYSAAPLTAAAGAAIERNFILGGSGTSTNSTGVGSAGVYLFYSNPLATDLLDNVIEGGTGSNPNGVGSAAVVDHAHADVLLSRNTVDLGLAPAGTSVGFFIDPYLGVHTVTNNEFRAAGISGTQSALYLRDVGSPVLSHNTFFLGPAGRALAIDPYRTSGVTAVMNDNLILSTGGTVVQNAIACGSGAIASFKGNALVGTFAAVASGSCGSQSDLTAFAAVYGSQVSGNFVTAATCGSTPFCVRRQACTSAMSCIQDVVTFSSADDGLAAVKAHQAWPPAPGAPCELFTAGFNDTSTVPIDFLGRTRGAPPTIGAVEPGCCGN